MRQLTEYEKEFRGNAFNLFVEAKSAYRGTVGETRAFNAGFIAGLDYQQAKFAALFQQLKGLLEMGASINDKSVEELVKELENETTN